MSIEDIGSKESNEDRTWLKRQRTRPPRVARERRLQVRVVPEAVRAVVRAESGVQADGRAGLADAANFPAARRSVSSAPKRSTRSRTAMYGCCNSLWPSAERSCRV